MLPAWPAAALLRRELRTTLRGKFAYVALVMAVLGVIAMVYVMLPAEQNAFLRAAQISEQLVSMITLGLAACALLFVCPLAAISISGERERDTFTMLHLTLLRPRGLIAAKFLNAAGFFMLVSIALLPVLGVVFFLVGIDIGGLLARYLLVLSFAIFSGAVGIGCSAWMRRSTASIIVTYVIVAGLSALAHAWQAIVVAPFLVALEMEWMARDSGVLNYLELLFGSLERELGIGPLEHIVDSRGWGDGPLLWALLFLLFAGLFIISAQIGVRRFRNPRQKAVAKPVDDFTKLMARRKQFPYYVIDPLRRKPPVPDGRNPLLVRELQWGLIGRATRMVRVFYVSAILQLLMTTYLYVAPARHWPDVANTIAIVDVIIVMLVAPVLTAGALAREVELGNMDLLRTTLLTPAEILHGKLYAALLSLAPLVLGCLVGPLVCLVMAWYWGEVQFNPVYPLLTEAVCIAYATMAGLLASSICRRTAQALILSYALIVCGMALLSLIFGFLMIVMELPERGLIHVFIGLSPVASLVAVSDFGDISSSDASWGLTWFCSLMLSVAFSGMFYSYATWNFAERRMRDQ
jgi:ABC-type transport system involved in multi-copper enzyme maturation permease subunit